MNRLEELENIYNEIKTLKNEFRAHKKDKVDVIVEKQLLSDQITAIKTMQNEDLLQNNLNRTAIISYGKSVLLSEKKED